MPSGRTGLYTLSLHDALPISGAVGWFGYDVVCLEKIQQDGSKSLGVSPVNEGPVDTCIAIRTMLVKDGTVYLQAGDRKSTRLNSSHTVISYAVFCLKKKTIKK